MLVSQKHRAGLGSFSQYLRSRGSSFAFALFLVFGLACGSFFCTGNTESAQLLRSIVINELSQQQIRSYGGLLLSALYGFGGIFVYIYFCVSSRKGAGLIYAVPLVFGISVGTEITGILLTQGYGAVLYVTVCVFLPKVVETLLLLSVCNKTTRYCKEQLFGQGGRRARRESFPILLYLVIFGIYFLLESLVVVLFRWLL